MSNTNEAKKIDIIKVIKKTETQPAPTFALPTAADKEFLRQMIEVIARELVSHPQDLLVRYECGEKTTIYHIDCTQRVLGQLLGAKGRNINGLRAVVQSISSRKGFRCIIELPYFKD